MFNVCFFLQMYTWLCCSEIFSTKIKLSFFFSVFFSVRLLSVLRGHSFFSSPPLVKCNLIL